MGVWRIARAEGEPNEIELTAAHASSDTVILARVRASCVASGRCDPSADDFQTFDRLLMKVGSPNRVRRRIFRKLETGGACVFWY